MKKETKIALLAAAGLASAAAGAAHVASRYVCDVAIRRNGPPVPERLKVKISGGAYSDPVLGEIEKAGNRARKLPTETVSITSGDGLVLTAHYYPADKPDRVLIAMHGWRSSWSRDYGFSCDFFHNEGCAIIYPDQRGTGNSGGEYIGFGVLERADCLDWVRYAVSRFGSDVPIYLVGISMGATTVLMTLGYELPPSVRGVIADCGFTSPQAIISHVMGNNMGISDKISAPIINSICSKIRDREYEKYSTVEALKNNKVPVLFIHGGNDRFVPISMTFENYEACTADKDLFIVPGAGHGMSYIVETEGYHNKVQNFFNKYDRQTK